MMAALVNAAALAAYAVCSRVQTFSSMPQGGITQGVQPIISYNTGSGSTQRVGRAVRLALRASVMYGLGAAALTQALAPAVVALFLDADPGARHLALWALRVLALAFVTQGLVPLVSAVYQATGAARPSYCLSVGTLLGVRVPLVLLVSGWGAHATWVAVLAGELASAALAVGLLVAGPADARRLWQEPRGRARR